MSPNYASHAVARDTPQSSNPERIVPQGFVQKLIAKLAWLWDPQSAETRYSFTSNDPRPRILRQDFEITLVQRDGEAEPRRFTWSIETETLFAGAGWVFGADFQLDGARNRFLSNAGKRGLMLDGNFYPHHRIDMITPGQVRVIQEGEEDRG
jgi:hypothetical protein